MQQLTIIGDPVSPAIAKTPTVKTEIRLRPYQEEQIAATLEAYDRGVRRVMIVAATGTGKTVTSAAFTGQMLSRGRVIFLAHREELIMQTVGKMRSVLGEDLSIGVVKAERDEFSKDIVVASVQTIINDRRLARVVGAGKIGTLIIDEAHHAAAKSYRDVARKLGCFEDDGPLVFGMTATPDRSDGVGLKAVFEEIVHEYGMLDAMMDGYLCDIQPKEVMLKADFGNIRITSGDFNAGDAGRELMRSEAPDVVAAAIKRYASDRQAIVFTPTVEVAHETAQSIREEGLTSEVVSAMTPSDQRRQIIADLHSGKLQTVCNVGVLTEGTDIPAISCIAVATPTKSRSRFVQMVGRGMRPSMGKEDCLVLDFVGAASDHRLQTISTLFGLPPKALKKRTVMEAIAEQQRLEKNPTFTGELVAKDVTNMKRRVMHWITTANGQYVLGIENGLLVLRYGGVSADGMPGFELWMIENGKRPERKHANLPLEYAQGIAEDLVREAGAENGLTKPDAAWRSHPVTEKQLARMRYMRIPTGNVKTKGQAADAMNAAEAMQKIASILRGQT